MTNRATVVACPSSVTSAWPKSTWASPGRWVRGMKTSARERRQEGARVEGEPPLIVGGMQEGKPGALRFLPTVDRRPALRFSTGVHSFSRPLRYGRPKRPRIDRHRYGGPKHAAPSVSLSMHA